MYGIQKLLKCRPSVQAQHANNTNKHRQTIKNHVCTDRDNAQNTKYIISKGNEYNIKRGPPMDRGTKIKINKIIKTQET